MGLFNFFESLFQPNYDILGLSKKPTGYLLSNGKIAYTGFPLPDTNERMKNQGYLMEAGIPVSVYAYPGSDEEFKAECATNPRLYSSPFQIDPLCEVRPIEESESWKEFHKQGKK